MSNEPELKAHDKVVLRMTRDGAVEKNLTAGTEQRVRDRRKFCVIDIPRQYENLRLSQE